MNPLEQEISEIVAQVAEIDVNSIIPDVPLRELGVDSLMGLEIALKIEQLHDVEFADKEIKSVQTFNDIIQLTRSKLALAGR